MNKHHHRRKKRASRIFRPDSHQLVQLAIHQQERRLRARFPNIRFLNDSFVWENGILREVMGIFLSDHNSEGVPAQLRVRLPNGSLRFVRTLLIPGTGGARISGGLDGSVYNASHADFPGSGCCLLQMQNDFYLLTNCHVLAGGVFAAPLYNVSDDVCYREARIGTWYYGNISPKGDFALVRIDDIERFMADVPFERFNNDTRAMTKPADLYSKVLVRGCITCSFTEAWLVDIVKDRIGIEYHDGQVQHFEQVLLLGDRPELQTCRPPTQFGDSGGAVYDDQGRLIGVITGRDERYTYAIPITQFTNDFTPTIL